MKRPPRVVAILATFNEERFIEGCLGHLFAQGVEVYLIDNCSTDGTVAIAERYRGCGLIDIESFPRNGAYTWRPILERKEELAATLDADWFMHVDADEIHVSPFRGLTLAESFAEVERQGCNAVEFLEFTFLPTEESPDHDHPRFRETMRWYYPHLPFSPHLLNAWKRQPERVDLATSGGHDVRFPGLRAYPERFPMRHYLFLSREHGIQKYVVKQFDAGEVKAGWHQWRAGLEVDILRLPKQSELRTYVSDDLLDPSNPRTHDYLGDLVATRRQEVGTRELLGIVAEGESFVLVDNDEWGTDDTLAGRRRIPFLERNGQYWGAPPDDATAIRDLARLRRGGAAYLVFASPAFWWLDHYGLLRDHVRSSFPCVLENERIVVFDLHERAVR